MSKKIILTGGGTAGHVTPNLALLPRLRAEGFDIVYIGSKEGIEKELICGAGVDYRAISSGKLRRYFDLKNVTDIFRVIAGIFQATAIIAKEKPDVIFSKGGFVAVPVAVGAFLNRAPFVAHESDMTPGLANRLAAPFAKKVCTTFPEAVKCVKGGKGVHTGTPIHEELFKGDADKGKKLCGFEGKKPVLLIMGGSLGSVVINNAVKEVISELTAKFDIAHIRGKGNLDSSLDGVKGYKQFEYVNKELRDLFAAADIVLSRAGANAISEFLALNKPMLLIPLSKKASRGDQILNADSFKAQGFAEVIEEEALDGNKLVNTVEMLYNNREKYISAMRASAGADGVGAVMREIKSALK
ncbi:MAG: undecaprenyldiphospho-muramoylpentapeptide beta-N-acetylglucosaminyltransferase [Firmicutes bacterium]|nr:undecaprenyldiphospho-muramoylpentapeptide beta-N-acetylglucosaminyltransferase [Bacillota bacterium]